MTTPRLAFCAPASVPPVIGGAERHWRAAVDGLRAAGFDVDLIEIPSPERTPTEIVASYRRFHELDVSAYDGVVSGKYPSWMVRHEHHVRHLNHPLRGLYDTAPRDLGDLAPTIAAGLLEAERAGTEELLAWAEAHLSRRDPDHPDHRLPGPFIRDVVRALDRRGAAGITHHAAVSETVARRHGYVPPGVPVAVIAPVSGLGRADLHAPTADSMRAGFVAFGRHDHPKRHDLAIAALRSARRQDLRLTLFGDGPEHDRLRRLAVGDERVALPGRCTDEELLTALDSASAAVLLAEDEDYGLVAAEAASRGCAVIACDDGGGLAEQVARTGGGVVVAPTRRAVRRAFEELADDPTLADHLGRRGRRGVRGETWDPLIELADPRRTRHRRTLPSVLILSTYSPLEVTAGGQARLRAVATRLSAHARVTVLSLDNEDSVDRRRLLPGGAEVVSIARSPAHRRRDFDLASLVGRPVDDIALARLAGLTPGFGPELDRHLDEADVIVCAQPYLAPLIADRTTRVPVVLDAHNVEAAHKSVLLEGHRATAPLLEEVRRIEDLAMELAAVTVAVTPDDAERLRARGAVRVVEAPNGLAPLELAAADDVVAMRRHLLGARRAPIVLFVGSDHTPNHDAADVLDELARERTDLAIVVAGSVCTGRRRRVVEIGVHHDGDTAVLHQAADVVALPIRRGGGSSLKVGTALACGSPIVATAEAVRGWPEPTGWARIGVSEAFATMIDATLTDSADTEARVRAGRRVAEATRWDETLTPLIDEVLRLAGTGPRSAG